MSYACRSLVTTQGDFASHDKRLSICLKADGFSFSETTNGGVLLTLGEAVGTHAASMNDATREIKAFFAEVGVRPLGYASSELIVLTDEHTWVPDELYSSLANRQYLKLVGGNSAAVMSCACKALGSTSVYAGNEQLAMSFKVALPGLTVINQHVKMVTLASRSQHPLMVTHWREGRVDVAAFRDGHCLYGNTLTFDNDDEALYRLVEVMRNSGIEGASSEMLMCGDVDRDRFARFRPYFPKTTLYAGEATHYLNEDFKRQRTYRHALILM